MAMLLQNLLTVTLSLTFTAISTMWPTTTPAHMRHFAPQASVGVIVGRTTLDDGTLLQYCDVKLDRVGGGISRIKNSGSNGSFRFDNLPFGQYVLRACGNRFPTRAEVIKVSQAQPLVRIRLHRESRGGEGNSNGNGRSKVGRTGPCLLVSSESGGAGLSAHPGEFRFVPLIVQHNCKKPDIFKLRVESPAGTSALMFDDSNHDGKHQESEQATSYTRLLAPRGEQRFLLRVYFPPNVPVKEEMIYRVILQSGTKKGTSGHTDISITLHPNETGPEK